MDYQKYLLSDKINDIVFYGPISLTLVENQADCFAKSKGIIWNIKMDLINH